MTCQRAAPTLLLGLSISLAGWLALPAALNAADRQTNAAPEAAPAAEASSAAEASAISGPEDVSAGNDQAESSPQSSAASSVSSTALALKDVFSASARHFPAIQAAVQETLIKRGEITRALGAFDLALEQDVMARTSGYYDGKAIENRLVKPIPEANGRLFAGYRYGSDDFPVYENEYITNGGGEFNLGAVFSLWRDRAIDSRRFGVSAARMAEQRSQVELTMARLMTQRNAARGYWRWVSAGLTYNVYARLVKLAEQRMEGLERRAAAGDVADIFVTENRQNLLRRRALATNALRNFREAGIALSLYLRDDTGTPRIPDAQECPDTFPALPVDRPATEAVIARAVSARPEVLLLAVDQSLEQQRLRLARNELLPRVDLGLKAMQDIGPGSETRDGFETKVDLTVSIPLERRRGQGSVAASQSRLDQLEWETRLAEDRIRTEVQRLANAIDTDIEFVRITRAEAEQARLLEAAERKRFAAGASDFFLVNLREERTADAELRNLEAYLDLMLSMTDYQATAVDFVALGLEPPR